MRKKAREDAFRILFEQLVNTEAATEKLARYFNAQAEKEEEPLYLNTPQGEDNAYVQKVVAGVEASLDEINCMIEKNLMGWEMERVSKISIAILRLSIYEIMHMDDIPVEVSANEAVTIAKKYDSQSAGSFVNGILGKVIQEIHG